MPRHRAGSGGDESRVFEREGEYWTIVFDGKVVRLPDVNGLRYLAELLRHPGEPVPAGLLVAASRLGAIRASEPAPREHEAERARVTVTKGIKSALGRIGRVHPSLGEHLAATIRRGYLCVYRPDPLHPVRWRV